MYVYACGHCKAQFTEPEIRRWSERIDGVHWCDMSEQICPNCGDPDIFIKDFVKETDDE